MKRFLLKSLLYSIPIITPIVLFTIFINPHLHGDIGPLGYITFADDYGKYNLPTNNKVVNCEYNYNNFSDSCILIIGDSFSQTNIASISYNYFLANYTNYKVVNLSQQCYTVSPFTRFMYFSKKLENLKKNNDDKTAKDIAIAHNQTEIAKFLDQKV